MGKCNDRWLDSQTVRQKDQFMDRCTDKQIAHQWIDALTDGWAVRETDRLNKWMDRQTNLPTYRQMDKVIIGWMDTYR